MTALTVNNKSHLLGRVIKGSIWTVAGNFASQILRFGSNLVLTHLLFPEAFGLMALIQSILIAMHLVSDVGLQQSLMRHEHANEPHFYNTIWTVQIIKGLIVFGAMLIASPIAAAFYHQPQLLTLTPAMALTAVLSGFNSTKAILLNRQLKVGTLTVMDLGVQVLGIVVMLAWARLSPSPWALVAGNLASSMAAVAARHYWLEGPGNRLHWDKSVIKEVWSFGGWVMVSSTVTFLVGEGRTLLNASLVDTRTLGLLSLSTTLAFVIWSALQQICGRVLFPAYVEVWQQRPQNFSSVVARARRIQLWGGTAVAAGLVFGGQALVHCFYDARYQDAGWFLRIQAAGAVFSFLTMSYSGVLWVLNRPKLAALLLAVQTVFMVICILGGYWLGGVHGLVIGSSFTGVLLYPVSAYVYHHFGLFQPRVDMPIIAIGVCLALYLFLHGV